MPAILSGLCAPSRMTSGSFWTTSSLPGNRVALRPAAAISSAWALIALEGNALAPVEPYQASYGRGIGACGDDFSWDGSWLWVKREDVLFAYDKNGNLQAKAAAPDGYRIGEFAANEEYIAAAAFGKGSNTLLIFDK